MTLNSSGAISLGGTTSGQSINLELNKSGTSVVSLNDTDVRTLAGVASGAITVPTDFYGKSSKPWTKRTAPIQYVFTSSAALRYINAPTPFLIFGGAFYDGSLYGTVSISYDAINWSAVDIDPGVLSFQFMSDIAYNGTTYVRSGTKTIRSATSLTGPWTERIVYDQFEANKVIYAGSRFVAVGDHYDTSNVKRLYTSTDGIIWTGRTTPDTTTGGLLDIAHNGTTYVVVGNPTTGGSPYIITSTDGATWTQRSISGYGNYAVLWVVWTGSYFIIPAGSGTGIYRSTDGATWTYVSTSYDFSQNNYVQPYAQNGYVIVPYSFGVSPRNRIRTSNDHGSTWSETTIPGTTESIVLAGYGFGKYIVVDYVGNIWTQDA